MARIAGVDLPREKQIETSLQYLYGIGKTTAQKICAAAQLDPTKRTKDLTEDEIHRIRETLEQGYKVEGDLRREVSLNIKRLMDLGCYRGLRHRKGLPVRGQRTHTKALLAPGFPKAVIVPHAGYIYSGPVAASAYDLLRPARGIVRRVVSAAPPAGK